MTDLEKALKALTITGDTVLFVDIEQVPIRKLELWEGLPNGLTIIGVRGTPNVEAMSVDELESILKRKREAV